MQASLPATSLLPASPGGPNGSKNASAGTASIGTSASPQAKAGNGTPQCFSDLLDHACEAETVTPEDGANEMTVEGQGSAQDVPAPELAQLLNQLITGGVRAAADPKATDQTAANRGAATLTTTPLQPGLATKGQTAEVQAITKGIPKGLVSTAESRTGEALAAKATLRKAMPGSLEADTAVSHDTTKSLLTSPLGDNLKLEAPSVSKAVEGRAQPAQTSVPQAVGNLLAQGAGVAGATTAMSTGTTPTAAYSAIPHEIHHAEFVPAFSARIAMLVRDGVEEAHLHLNPVEMGPVALKLSLDGQQVRVDMTAEQAGTRQVLEQSMPALAGALRDAGFTLAGGGVFQPSDEAPGRARNSPAGSEVGAGQPGQDDSAAWSSASGQPSDGRRPQDQAPGTMPRAFAATGMDGNGATDSAMTLSVPTGTDGTVRWPAGTRLVDMFA